MGLTAGHGWLHHPGAVPQGNGIGAGAPDRTPHEADIQTRGLRKDVRHLEGNGVRGVLIEDLAEEIPTRPDDGVLLEFVEQVEIRHIQGRIEVSADDRCRGDPHGAGVVHPQEVPSRIRPGIQRVLPPSGCRIVLPGFRTVPHEDEVIIAVELAVAVVHHLYGQRHQVQRPRYRIVDGQGVSPMTVEVDVGGVDRGCIHPQCRQQCDVHLVETGPDGGHPEPLAFRQGGMLGPIVGKLSPDHHSSGEKATQQPHSP